MRVARAVLRAQVAAVRGMDRISPAVAGRWAYPLFRRAGPRLAVRPEQVAIHRAATKAPLRVRGRDVVSYEWGKGDRAVLLVHGWRGRAAQFAPLVTELTSAGYRVVAFDAPANGDSPGHRVDVTDWVAAIEALHARYGPFQAIVGHSFGAMAALAAVKGGVKSDALISIAGVADARYLVTGFASRLGVSQRAAMALAETFARKTFSDADPWVTYDGTVAPLPGGMSLLVIHDVGDREVEVEEARRLHHAHRVQSRLVETSGFGHSRVIGAAPTVSATRGLLDQRSRSAS